jgi:hypothetical protein
MPLTDVERAAMIRATHETAVAMADDLQHMREIIAKPEPTPGDIRRMSNLLRRILIDHGGDLRKVAPPRLGKRLELVAPDLEPLERAGEEEPWPFLSAGFANVLGIGLTALTIPPDRQPKAVDDYRPSKTILLSLDRFRSQKVACFRGRWVSRDDMIKYVANVAHGVHSSDPKEENHELLRKIRYIATAQIDGEMPVVSFNVYVPDQADKPLSFDRRTLDFLLIQLLSTASYLTDSPDVIELERIIQREQTS